MKVLLPAAPVLPPIMLVHLFRVGIRGGTVLGRPLLPLRFQTFSTVR